MDKVDLEGEINERPLAHIKESKMKLIDTIELLTEILVGKKEDTRSQKKTRTTNVKTKRKITKKKK